MRLQGGDATDDFAFGSLQILQGATWSDICPSSLILAPPASSVACRQLGYAGGVQLEVTDATSLPPLAAMPVVAPVMAPMMAPMAAGVPAPLVNCNGSEVSLMDCPVVSCSGMEASAAECPVFDATAADITVECVDSITGESTGESAVLACGVTDPGAAAPCKVK